MTSKGLAISKKQAHNIFSTGLGFFSLKTDVQYLKIFIYLNHCFIKKDKYLTNSISILSTDIFGESFERNEG